MSWDARPENDPLWSSPSCFREVSGGRSGMTELEAEIFCDPDPDTHAHVLIPTHKRSHPTRALQAGRDL